jgi:hypothetical protein
VVVVVVVGFGADVSTDMKRSSPGSSTETLCPLPFRSPNAVAVVECRVYGPAPGSVRLHREAIAYHPSPSTCLGT